MRCGIICLFLLLFPFPEETFPKNISLRPVSKSVVPLFSSLMCIQSLIHVPLFSTPWTVACQASLPMEFFQARILEWVAIYFSRGSSQPRDGTCVSFVSCIGRWVLYHERHLGSQWGHSKPTCIQCCCRQKVVPGQ